MEISDTDLAAMDECELDMIVINATYVTCRSQGRLFARVKVKDVPSGMKLMSALWAHHEGLVYENEKVSE